MPPGVDGQVDWQSASALHCGTQTCAVVEEVEVLDVVVVEVVIDVVDVVEVVAPLVEAEPGSPAPPGPFDRSLGTGGPAAPRPFLQPQDGSPGFGPCGPPATGPRVGGPRPPPAAGRRRLRRQTAPLRRQIAYFGAR